MKLTLSAAALAALAAGTAGAAVNNTSVTTNLSLNSTVVGTAGIRANSGISDIGTYMGQVGTNSAIRGKYAAQMVGAAGSGAHGGNVYAVTVTVGSIATGPGPFANPYKTNIISSTDTIAGQNATCVDVPLPGGTAVYCALDNGLVAKLDDGDVLVTLTLYGEVVDPNAFVIP